MKKYPKKIKLYGILNFLYEEELQGKTYGVYIKNRDTFMKFYIERLTAFKHGINMTINEKIKKIFFILFKHKI